MTELEKAARQAMEALEDLKSVLTDHDGNVCWQGSYADRDTIGDALDKFERFLAAQPAQQQEPVAIASDDSGIYAFWARNKEAEKQSGVKFLANATRFKVRLTKHDCKINNLPRELGGRWVALVAADDNCHLQLTTPPAAQRQWVDMPELELLGAYEKEQQGRWGDHVRGLLNVQAKLREKNAATPEQKGNV